MPSLSDAAREMFGQDPQNNNEITNWIYIFTVLNNAPDAAPGEIAFPTQINRMPRVVNQLITGGNDQSKNSLVYIVPYSVSKSCHVTLHRSQLLTIDSQRKSQNVSPWRIHILMLFHQNLLRVPMNRLRSVLAYRNLTTCARSENHHPTVNASRRSVPKLIS
jgi:hypothetical protein